MITILLLSVLTINAQTLDVKETNEFGIENVHPTFTIEIEKNGTHQVYHNNEFGIRNVTPSFQIKENDNGYQIIKYDQYGIRKNESIIIKPKSYKQQIN